MEIIENDLFQFIENIIKNVYLEKCRIYDSCILEEKLHQFSLKTYTSYKVFKNYNIINFYKMKKVNDKIGIRVIDDTFLLQLKSKFPNLIYKENDIYAYISFNSISELTPLSSEIAELFKYLFLLYLNTEESFGCCSKYVECSNNLECINDNMRLKFACLYKKNLEQGKIFYGINKNI